MTAMLMDCMATMPPAAGSRARARMTKLDKAKNPRWPWPARAATGAGDGVRA